MADNKSEEDYISSEEGTPKSRKKETKSEPLVPRKRTKKGDHDKKTAPLPERVSQALENKSPDLSPDERVLNVLDELEATEEGLTSAQAAERLAKYGPNSLPEHHENPLLKFLGFLWNPLSWVMEIAALVSIVLIDYVDFILIVFLLLLNASIAYWEESTSGDAIAALKNQLTPTCKCLRDGTIHKELRSTELVPGDIVLLRLGDIIPADSVLLKAEGDGLKIDQASLTGESLPVKRITGDQVYSGSIVKQGEMRAVVQFTGANTFFGKAATLVDQASKGEGHVHQVLARIGYFCICIICVGVLVELIVQFVHYGSEHKINFNESLYGYNESLYPSVYTQNFCTAVDRCEILNNALVLIVGGVPIAMPTVLSVTMAIGAGKLATKEAIVSRLTAVEELAGMDILCSDKTGTLTQNKLTVADPIAYNDYEPQDVLFYASLAANADNNDAIDLAMINFLTEDQQASRNKHQILHYHPFDPVGKKTWAKVKTPDGNIIHTCKGAPQVVLQEASNKKKMQDRVDGDIDKLASGGYRSLGVSISDENGKDYVMIGIIPLFDPPRHDTADTIKACNELGVSVKMITGDQLAIAKETAKLLGMGQNIHPAKLLKDPGQDLVTLCETADGFAQVFPEDKFDIVKQLQKKARHCVGMTGDGVNDAPALKKADIGIAVSDSTDAARAASDIVLMTPGLRVIEEAIVGARKIFQRMKNYCMYSISATVRIVLSFSILTMVYNWYFPTIGMVFFAILNDGSMLTISKDRVKPSPEPDEWNFLEIFGIALTFGVYLTISTIVFFHLVYQTDVFPEHLGVRSLKNEDEQVRGVMYLMVSISGLATIFVTRSYGFSFMEKPAVVVLIAFGVAQTAASFLGAYGLNGYPEGRTPWRGSGWGWVLIAWIWSMIWYIPMDFLKFFVRGLVKGRLRLFQAPPSASKRLVAGHPFGGDHPAVEAARISRAKEFIHNPRQSVEIVSRGQRAEIYRQSQERNRTANVPLEQSTRKKVKQESSESSTESD